MYPFWVFQNEPEINTRKSHVPSPENQKPLDFRMVFTSIEKAKASDLLFVGGGYFGLG